MIDRERREQLIVARRERAARATAAQRVETLVTELRRFYYPKQRDFFRSRAKMRATKKTRRSGATAGGCRELVARALETPGFRAVYITTTRIEARARAWENDTKSGLVDVIRRYGTALDSGSVPRFDMAGVTVDVRGSDLALVFSNGSLIELFGADDEDAINKLRGLAKHVYWIDEAQDFVWLERLYKAVISAGMRDFGGECWLTGTPGADCAGFFFDVTRDDAPGLPGWEVHRIAVVDNPFFGRVMWEGGKWFVVDNLGEQTGPFATENEAEAAAVKVRWDRTAGAAILENAWDEDDPDLLREWYARWVKADARYVYSVHAVPEHQLVYAPQRLDVDGFPDIARALLDLPGRADGRDYMLGLGADLGTTDAFAFTLDGWSLRDPVLYEVCSWKREGMSYDEMAAILHAVRAKAVIGMVVADAGGGGKGAVVGWSKDWAARYNLPIIEADKRPNYKPLAVKQYNNDIKHGMRKFRVDSPLLVEMKGHRWASLRSSNGKLVEDASTPNHCCDSALYIHMHSYHHRFREPPPKILPGTPEWVLREERELERAAQEAYR